MRDIGWDCNYCWNIWGIKYTLWALIESAMLLDDSAILDGAKKLADWVIAKLDDTGVRLKDTGVMHGMASSSIMKPMLVLYRLTADEKYLALAKSAAAEFDKDDGETPNLIRNALSGVPVSKWYEAPAWYAKAYEMMSCFDGLIELYRVTGEERLFLAAQAFWELLYKYESNILGSVGYCERFADAPLYPDSATEVCDAIHWMRISYELFCLTGEGKYVFAFERAFLNAFLAGVNDDGRGGSFFVRSAGRHYFAEPQCDTKYQNCCLNNVGRGFANAAEIIASECGGDLYINSFIPATVRISGALVRIGKGYVDLGKVAVTVRGAKVGSRVHLLVPDWCDKLTVMINGVKSEYNVSGEYVPVTLKTTDTVLRIELAMKTILADFGGEYRNLPDNDYHVQRWCDSRNGPTRRDVMVKHPMTVVRRGPVILARTKRLGAKEEDLFSGKTVHGKSPEVETVIMRNDYMLATYKIKLTFDGECLEYVMCDFASAANKYLEDAHYFSVFI